MLKKINGPKEKLTIGLVSDMGELDDCYVLREGSCLYFTSKNTFELVHRIQFPIDHELGYKRLICHNDIICTTVYNKKDGDSLLGDPNYVELQLFKDRKLLWKKELFGWTLSANYGGVHLCNDNLLVFEKINENNVISLINLETGELIDKVDIDPIPNISQIPHVKNDLIALRDKVFLPQRNGFKSYGVVDDKIKVHSLIEEQVYRIAISDSNLYLMYIVGMDLLVNCYDLQSLELVNEKKLNFDFDFDRAFITPDDQYLMMNDSKMKFIAGYSLTADKLIWKKEIGDQIVSTQIQILDNNRVFYLSDLDFGAFGVLDIPTGNEIARYVMTNEASRPWFPVNIYDNYIFLNFGDGFSRMSLSEVF